MHRREGYALLMSNHDCFGRTISSGRFIAAGMTDSWSGRLSARIYARPHYGSSASQVGLALVSPKLRLAICLSMRRPTHHTLATPLG